MADNARPPVAVRIVRPYETEEAFLESELETVGKTSVILIGAHSRPTGVILRFEVTLASGATILRGEGRVLAHKESAFRGQPGLALRFTRLDPKSKALVDRAAAIREARLSGESIPPMPPPSVDAVPSAPSLPEAPPSAPSPTPSSVGSGPGSMRPGSMRPAPGSMRPGSMRPGSMRPSASAPPSTDPAIAEILGAPTPEPAPVTNKGAKRTNRRSGPASAPPSRAPVDAPVEAPVDDTIPPAPNSQAAADEAPPSLSAQEHEPSAPPNPPSVPRLPASVAPPGVEGTARVLPPPPDREALLTRLRQRATTLTPDQTAAILRER